MDIRELPRLLFQEFGTNVRAGSDGILVADTEFCGRHGKPIMLTWHPEEYGRTHLKVWYWEPGRDGVEPGPLLCITAGSGDAGVWAYGKGRKLQERAILNGCIQGWPSADFGHAHLQLIGRLILRAAELRQSGMFECGSFWESERAPEGDDEKP